MEAVLEKTESFDVTDMLHFACNEEASFLSLVKAESAKIPLSVRMFPCGPDPKRPHGHGR